MHSESDRFAAVPESLRRFDFESARVRHDHQSLGALHGRERSGCVEVVLLLVCNKQIEEPVQHHGCAIRHLAAVRTVAQRQLGEGQTAVHESQEHHSHRGIDSIVV